MELAIERSGEIPVKLHLRTLSEEIADNRPFFVAFEIVQVSVQAKAILICIDWVPVQLDVVSGMQLLPPQSVALRKKLIVQLQPMSIPSTFAQ